VSIRAFRDMFPHTIILETWASQNAYGEPTFSTCSHVPARVEMRSRLIAGSAGREISARGRIFLGSTVIPSTKDRVTLPAGFLPRQPPILDVYPVTDEKGLHHICVYIG